jgi:acetamidase/formamidase
MLRATLVLCLPILACAADVAGSWNSRLVRFGEESNPNRLELKTEGKNLSGSFNDLKLAGTVDGDHLHFTATNPQGKLEATFDGRVQGDEIAGTIKAGDENLVWKARRATQPGPPQTRTFEPTVFHRNFTGTIPPALHINPGDTIQTWTVDAGGVDHKGVRRSMGGNPETGPFYVEGAMPGDTLAIKFHRIRLNRDTAESGDRVIGPALTPGYNRNAKYADNFDAKWKLDREAGTASLAKPTDRLKNFKVKLQPMLGCVGVAPPANQSFRTGWLGSWGGNMDYNGLREGVTVYLPVYQEGALLFVGDGHAAEGDGELTGDALETSMDIEFTVDVIRGKATPGPRFESDEFLMASGIANSLPEALQMATTELARWLERDYKLSANESNVILGAAIRYDIAEVVDPQVHIVAKVSKALLAELK